MWKGKRKKKDGKLVGKMGRGVASWLPVAPLFPLATADVDMTWRSEVKVIQQVEAELLS